MNLTIHKSSVPIPRQLEQQIKGLVWAGSLTPGSQLPTVRELAGFLRVNRNTVARTYKTLESEGFVVTQGARGTFVSDSPPPQPQADAVQLFLAETIRRAAELGMDAEALALALLAETRRMPQHPASGHRLLLVECNTPQLEQLQAELETALPVQGRNGAAKRFCGRAARCQPLCGGGHNFLSRRRGQGRAGRSAGRVGDAPLSRGLADVAALAPVAARHARHARLR